MTCWTSRARGKKGGGNIIDRIISSKSLLIDSDIGVADRFHDFVPSTDHRVVVGQLVYTPPASSPGSRTVLSEVSQVFNKPRIKYPYKSEKHRFATFTQIVDRRIEAEALHTAPVIDDQSYIARYEAITKILIPSAEEVFGRNSRFKKRLEVTSPRIQFIASTLKNIGGAIRHVKSDYRERMSFASTKTFNFYAAEYSRILSQSVW
jgi:hypothetical protein